MDPRVLTLSADEPAAPRPTSVPVSRRRLALGCAIVVTTALVGVPLVHAVASTGADTKVINNVIPGLSKLDDLGAVADDKPMTIGVSLPGNTAAREAAYQAMTTPGSASYGSTYTPASFAAAFGVSAEVSQSVQGYVEGDGLKPVYTAKDGSYVELSGTAAQVEKTFKLSVHNFLVGGKTYFASTTGATVPAAVGSVLGLTDFDKAHIQDSQTTCVEVTCTGVVAPDALWASYDEPDTYKEGDASLKSTDDYGQGQKVAIFGEGDLTQVVTDLRNFEDDTDVNGDTTDVKPKLPHIPVAETLVNDPQGLKTTDTAGVGEWDLDSQSSTGMSPDLAQLQFYFGPDLDDDSIAATYSAWVNDTNGALIGNSSFGGCEPLENLEGAEATDDALLQQAVMMGRSMFASTGDTGSGGCVVAVDLNGLGNGGVPAIEYPSASPYVVAVGGTVLYTAADTTTGDQAQPVVRGEEYAWTFTGGGSADFEPQPDDQSIANLGAGSPNKQPCVGTDTGVGVPTGAICRAVPDVAAMSGDVVTNGYGIESNSKPGMPGSGETETGGTSLSSPLWAGMWARVLAAHSASGCANTSAVTKAGLTTVKESTQATINFAQPALYDVAESSSANDDAAFFDIGGTTNNQPGTAVPVLGNGAYTALPRVPIANPTGYDLVSGLGVPDLANLTLILDCTIAPASTTVPNSIAVTIVTAAATTTGTSCPPNGTETDPSGDEGFPADSAVDLTAVNDTANTTAVTFTETLAALPENNPLNEDLYDSDFTYDNVAYYVEYDDGNGGGTPAFTLYTANTSTGLNSNATTLATLTGTENDSTGVISVVLPYATFNSTAKPTIPLQAGATFSGMEVEASNQLNDDTVSFGSCTFNLPGDTTTPSTPSATPTMSATASATPTTSATASATPTMSATASATPTTSATASATPTMSATASATPSTSATASATPTMSASPTTTPTTSAPSLSPTPTTTYSPAPVPTFPTYAAPITTSTPTPTTVTSTTPATRFHPLSYSTLNSKTVANGHDESVKIVGVSGVPTTNVVDVLLQVTADQATGTAPVLVDSDFGTKPAQQAVAAVPGKTVRNVILVTPDSSGVMQIEVTNGAKARIALAVVGYDSLGAGDGFHPTFGGRVSATLTSVTTSKKPLAVVIGGKGGVPAGSLDAALLDARVGSVSLPKKVTSATLYATVGGTSKKTAIATITSSGTTTSLLVVRPDSHGKVTFSLSAGSAKIVVNEYGTWASAGYTAAHTVAASLRFGHPMSALTEFSGNLGTGTKTVTLTGLPADVSTVILQVAVGYGSSAGEVALATTGARFGDGSLSYLPAQGSVQLVSIAPDKLGRVSLHTTKGSRAVTLALVGYTALS